MSSEHRANGAEHRPDPVDVDALMTDIRRRVAEKRAQGLYSVDALAAGAVDETGPLAPEELERLRDLAVQRVDLATLASTKPVLGPIVAQVKRRLTRAVSQPLYSMAAHASSFNSALVAYVARLGREAAALRDDLERARADASGAAGQVAALNDALAETERRLAEAERELARLRAEGLHERVSRLEQGAPPAERAEVTAPAAPEDVPAGILGLLIEARDWSDADAARWAESLAGAQGTILHLGCGSGRGLAALGADAQGVDDDPELVAAGRREERAVTCADPVEFATALGPRSLGGALVTGLVERLDAARLGALLAALGRALAEAAPLVVEGLDPRAETVIAGEAWRDPRRVRPLHPDAIVAVVEAAGMSVVRVEEGGEAGRWAVHAAA